MSYESSAALFYGFPLLGNTTTYRNLIDSVRPDSPVKVNTYGCCHGEMGLYVYLVSSCEEVELGRIKAFDYCGFTTPAPWDAILRDFATAHNLPWPEDYPRWHLTAQRS